MMNDEIWKPVVGFEGYYEVSNKGKVMSLDRIITCKAGGTYVKKGKMLKLHNSRGYVDVHLVRGDKTQTVKVHRLVADAFIPNPNNLPEINHKDEVRNNNDVNNLEWCTKKYNMNYGTRNERAGKAISKALKGKYVGENSPVFGRHHTEEAKAKNRDAHVGKIPWMKGKRHTEEAKQKLREKQLAFQKRKREKDEEQDGEDTNKS